MEPFKPYIAVVDTEKDPLNVREKPNKGAKILFRLPRGRNVWVMEDTGNGWARVEDDGVEGYASLQYLKKAPDSIPDAPNGADGEQPVTGADKPVETAKKYFVLIACESEEAAQREATATGGRVIIQYKPPDAD